MLDRPSQRVKTSCKAYQSPGSNFIPSEHPKCLTAFTILLLPTAFFVPPHPEISGSIFCKERMPWGSPHPSLYQEALRAPQILGFRAKDFPASGEGANALHLKAVAPRPKVTRGRRETVSPAMRKVKRSASKISLRLRGDKGGSTRSRFVLHSRRASHLERIYFPLVGMKTVYGGVGFFAWAERPDSCVALKESLPGK